MAATFLDAVQAVDENDGAMSVSLTTTTGVDYIIAYAFSQFSGASAPSSVTWNGNAMSLVASETSGTMKIWAYSYQDVVPRTAGCAMTCEANWFRLAVFSVAGATGIRATQTLQAGDWDISEYLGPTVTSNPLDLVCGGVTAYKAEGAFGNGITPTGTERMDLSGANGTRNEIATWAGASPSVNPTWTQTSENDSDHTSVVLSVQGKPDVSGVIWFWFERYQKFLRDLKAGLISPRDVRRRHQEVYSI